MARRRMFSKDIVHSARFLKLPPEARLLYYDLGMAADDDGVVEAYTVMATTGARDAALKALVQRGFVRVLNEDMVTWITDWKRNNYLQKDRYTPGIYHNLVPDEECIQDVYKVYTQDRGGEERKVEERGEKGSRGEGGRAAAPSLPSPPSIEDVNEYIRSHGLMVDGRKFYEHYAAKGWMQDNGKPIGRWWGRRLERWAESEYNRPAQEPPEQPQRKTFSQLVAEQEDV